MWRRGLCKDEDRKRCRLAKSPSFPTEQAESAQPSGFRLGSLPESSRFEMSHRNAIWRFLLYAAAIWLSSGWVGLFSHWQALSAVACLPERTTAKEPPAFPAGLAAPESLEGEPPCAVVKSEAI